MNDDEKEYKLAIAAGKPLKVVPLYGDDDDYYDEVRAVRA